MDFRTLAVSNLLLFVLYAAVMVVQARLLGRSRASAWFAAANLAQAAAMLALILAGHGRYGNIAFAMSGLLLVTGVLLLHRSFAEMLERNRLLWRLHLALFAVVLAATVLTMLYAPGHPALVLLTSAVLGIQAALTASALFSFAGEGVEVAGRFSGIALCAFALINLMRATVVFRYASWQYRTATADMDDLWLAGLLLSSGAAAFGFMFLSAAKLRIELLWRAQIDELTGLLNRWAFKRIAVKDTNRCMRNGSCLAVVMMDLDGMKGINDRLGHSCGDAVLQAVAAALQAGVRDRDSIARMGGDEFCIVLPDTDITEALTVAGRLRSQIEALVIRYRNESVKIRASFGVSSSDRVGWVWQNLIDQADAALYHAKRGGNQRVIAAEPAHSIQVTEAQVAPAAAIEERRKATR